MVDVDYYRKFFTRIYRITDIVKLRNFQYRLMLNKIFTNDILCKWNITATSVCDMCDSGDVQGIHHLLMTCDYAQKVWVFVKTILNDIGVF